MCSLTWNHNAFTTLLRRNNGITQTVWKIKDKIGWIQDHTKCPINESVPNITAKSLLMHGKRPYSNSKMLSRNIPPFKILHWNILLPTLDSLKNKVKWTTLLNIIIKECLNMSFNSLKYFAENLLLSPQNSSWGLLSISMPNNRIYPGRWLA